MVHSAMLIGLARCIGPVCNWNNHHRRHHRCHRHYHCHRLMIKSWSTNHQRVSSTFEPTLKFPLVFQLDPKFLSGWISWNICPWNYQSLRWEINISSSYHNLHVKIIYNNFGDHLLKSFQWKRICWQKDRILDTFTFRSLFWVLALRLSLQIYFYLYFLLR